MLVKETNRRNVPASAVEAAEDSQNAKEDLMTLILGSVASPPQNARPAKQARFGERVLGGDDGAENNVRKIVSSVGAGGGDILGVMRALIPTTVQTRTAKHVLVDAAAAFESDGLHAMTVGKLLYVAADTKWIQSKAQDTTFPKVPFLLGMCGGRICHGSMTGLEVERLGKNACFCGSSHSHIRGAAIKLYNCRRWGTSRIAALVGH